MPSALPRQLDTAPTRIEQDLIGERLLPADALHGIHTLRAVENFAISGRHLSDAPELIRALAAVKWAAAEANQSLGLLSPTQGDAITRACREIHEGAWHDAFIVDLIQGGAGTSTNMNANEVIANRALDLLGQPRGSYGHLHPNDHVNLGQSTNDVYPTAVRIATLRGIEALLGAMAGLRQAFARKADAFADVIKMGRTQLQEAVPMTLGQEFRTYAVMLGEDEARLRETMPLLCEINLGATAIGTGITAHPDYAARAREALNRITGLSLSTAPDLIEATQDCGVFVHVSGVVKRAAVKLSKVCNDLRLLSSGPRSGFHEINLPAMQAGSSIMPGKVNPVIPEVVNQVAFEVIGNDMTITMAAEAGQLQLNAFEPVIFASLERSLRHLTHACQTLQSRCIEGITANRAELRETVERSIGLATALAPVIGYKAATALALEAHASGRSVLELARERQLAPAGLLEACMNPSLPGPHLVS